MFALAVIQASDVNGVIRFRQACACLPVEVDMKFRGTPRAIHAIHVHQWGDLRKGCESLGPHYDRGGNHTHGSIFVPNRPRHAGDLVNNLTFDARGRFSFAYTDDMLTLFGDESIMGRSIVIHALPDDLGLGGDAESLKTGNAGKRIACAVIGRCDAW